LLLYPKTGLPAALSIHILKRCGQKYLYDVLFSDLSYRADRLIHFVKSIEP